MKECLASWRIDLVLFRNIKNSVMRSAHRDGSLTWKQ
ncbi:hypothetical protein E2C01_003590 [Portunus trituberculatus]|uniref:Uncharacterized protein n=1 Tax=Portunus trituberculatus TaxID=210409 RepID=A0A5B7CRP0_PORTR|nr:hypothetical protein [Portunus trituberculatus]